MRLYECGVRFDKMMENGAVKKVTELYLVDALTFTEAEARITQEIAPYMSGEFDVATIKRTNYSEIAYDQFSINSEADAQVQKLTRANSQASDVADKWFKAKVNFITIDEKSGRERKSATHFIINAGSINAAHDTLVSHMKGTMADYEIATLDETRIMDVYIYSADGSKSLGVKEANVKQSARAILDKMSECGVESVTMTASDGKTTRSATLNIPNPKDPSSLRDALPHSNSTIAKNG